VEKKKVGMDSRPVFKESRLRRPLSCLEGKREMVNTLKGRGDSKPEGRVKKIGGKKDSYSNEASFPVGE